MTQDIVGSCARRLRDSLSPLIPRDRPVALVDFPETTNCGDHAIWLGENILLADLNVRPAYQCSASHYDRAEMAAKLGSGTILVHGGTLGGRPQQREQFRSRVLSDFPDHRAIFFPQAAISLGSETLAGRATLFAESLAAQRAIAARYAGMRVELAPDMAFLLGAQPRLQDPVYDIVWIARTDDEGSGDTTEAAARLSSQAAEKFPIPGFDDGVEMSFVAKHRPPTVLLTDWSALVYDHVEARLALKRLDFDAQSKVYVSRAMSILSLGHVVITDRLHGHILCLLLGIPHVFLDSRSGGNLDFHESWTRDSGLCRIARNPAEAWTLARNAVAKLKEVPQAQGKAWSWRDLSSDSAGHSS